MDEARRIYLGQSKAGEDSFILSSAFNKHGVVTGATGTGKTVTLQILAEKLSRLGVSVVAADVKGDLSGIAEPGREHPKIAERVEKLHINDFSFEANPVCLWDVFGERGLPLRTTISEVGPLLLSNILQLNDNQEGLLHLVFRIADAEGLLLLDLKDLREALRYVSEERDKFQDEYGLISPQSVGAIQRRLVVLEEVGGDKFFGEPGLSLSDLLQCDFSGRGVIHLLDSTKLINEPRLFSSVLLWILSELFEQLPEVGERDLPRLVFFFDEAHLLFETASEPLLEKIEQLVRLIRSRGVGVFFVSQHPLDIPEKVSRQLGTRILHALRSTTPREAELLERAAKTFPSADGFDFKHEVTTLGVGEAIVTSLNEDAAPTEPLTVYLCPPRSRIGPCDGALRSELLSRNPLSSKYTDSVDRESAFEILKKRREELSQSAPKRGVPPVDRDHSKRSSNQL